MLCTCRPRTSAASCFSSPAPQQPRTSRLHLAPAPRACTSRLHPSPGRAGRLQRHEEAHDDDGAGDGHAGLPRDEAARLEVRPPRRHPQPRRGGPATRGQQRGGGAAGGVRAGSCGGGGGGEAAARRARGLPGPSWPSSGRAELAQLLPRAVPRARPRRPRRRGELRRGGARRPSCARWRRARRASRGRFVGRRSRAYWRWGLGGCVCLIRPRPALRDAAHEY